MRIAYLINQYPKVSHSFIRREILALERQGVAVQRMALRGWQDELVDAEDMAERACTRYVLQDGISGLLLSTLMIACTKPLRFLAGLTLACRLGWRADRPLPYHLIYLAEACRVALWLKRSGATHLHVHFGTNSAEVAMLAGVLIAVPYSLTIHGPEEFDKAEFIGLGEKIRRAGFVVAISSFCRSQLFRSVAHTYWSRIHVVHCGLEPDFYGGHAVPITQRPRLVCIGRLCEQKGQQILIAAAALLARKGIEFELVLAGDGEMRAEVEAMIAACGLETRVRITGWISSEQVREELLAARALVMASFAEGLPVVIMEAMSLQRPVLTTWIAGIPELVMEGENGWLYPPGSVDELALAMKRCLHAPVAQLEEMGRQARTRVLARHDIDQEAAKMIALFRQLAVPGQQTAGVHAW